MFEFGVHGRSDDSGRIRVIGRCFSGPILVGSVFSRMRRYLGDEPLSEAHVKLEVVEIEAYRRRLDAMDSGLTGALVLKGQVPDALDDGWVLGG